MYLDPEKHFPAVTSAPVFNRVAALHEKGSGAANEDLIWTGVNTFAVFDGSTSLVPRLFENGVTGGRMAAQITSDIFSDESIPLQEAAQRSNAAIRARAIAHGVDYRNKEEMWSTSLAAVRLNGDQLDWCRIGDCQILAVYEDNTFRLLGQTPNHDGDTLAGWLKKSKKCSGTVMDIMASEIRRVRKKMNIDYGVLNGEREALEFLQLGREPLAGVRAVILYSDGLMLPQQDPYAKQDLKQFTSLYETGGLESIRDHVRSVQRSDISCRKYPRFKTHDDIAAVAVTF